MRDATIPRKHPAPYLFLAAMVAVTSLATPADAEKKSKPGRAVRHVEARYDSPAAGVQSQPGGVCADQTDADAGLGCVVFVAKPTERFISVKIVDTLGLTVPGWVQTETDVVLICGKTTNRVPVEPGTENFVWVWASSGLEEPCPGAATRGVVKATFSNLP